MSDVAVVTDSTAYLPPGMADRHGISEVPLHVVLGARTGAEHDVQRDLGDPVRVGQPRRQVRRAVGDHGDAHGSAG